MPLNAKDIAENAQLYKKTSFSFLFKKENYLFKIFKDYEWQNLEMIEYLNGLYDFVSKNNILPKELIYYGDIITGYSEEFINGFTFKEALRKPIPIEKKVEVINHISLALQDINQYLIIGDINLQNLLIPENRYDKNGYIIDFDFAKEINDDIITLVSYKIKINNNRINENLNTDKIKMFISFLSLLYGYDFENFVSNYKCTNTLEDILEKLEKIKNTGILAEYTNYLNWCLVNDITIDEYFFIPKNYNIEKEIEVGRRLICQKKNKL